MNLEGAGGAVRLHKPAGKTTVYNVIAIPATAGMFLRWGVNLPIRVGAIAMNLSTIIVALNAQLLLRIILGP
jgi:Cu2+-exporting ATPase